MRPIIYILTLLSVLETTAQNWAKVSTDKFNDVIERVLFDSVHNKLVVSSKFVNKVENLNVRGVASWNGIKWDSLAGGINTHNKNFQPYPGALLLAGISYNGKFLVGGNFTSIGDINTAVIALWDGIKWDSLPKRAFRSNQYAAVSGFFKQGNLIYIHGDFDTIANQPAQGLATWNGTNFNPIPLPAQGGFQGISSVAEYQNELYITGGIFDIGLQHARDVLRFNGTSWASTTGGGFNGGFSGVGSLIIYNNELYACGHFTQADGDPADNVMKWDGSHWQDVGFGNTASFISINKMLVYQSKLWVFGQFTKVAGAFTSNVAVYDGTTWCGLKDTLDNGVESATIYNDTIYIGGYFQKANSDSITYIAKLTESNLFNQCINVVGVKELSANGSLIIYPNPTTSILNVSDEQNPLQNSTITITNYLGQSVLCIPFSNRIDLSTLSSGMYFLTVHDKSMSKTVKVVKE